MVWSEQLETKISADVITVEGGEILYAEGNVLVQYGRSKIKAKALEFKQKSQKIKFIELRDFYDGKAIKISAAEALINSDLSEGTIQAANLFAQNSSRTRSAHQPFSLLE